MIDFEWDEDKNRINQHKHGVSFEEAKTVFRDFLAVTTDDPDHSPTEHREKIMGMSEKRRLLSVVFVEHHKKIRIISARCVTKHERNQYEEER